MAATIPDIAPSYSALGNMPTPVSERSISTADVTQVAQATTGAAKMVGEEAQKLYNEQGKLDYEFAKSNYVTKMIEFEREEQNNPDWQGAPDRWKKASQDGFEELRKTISHPQFRAEFDADARGDINRQYSSFLGGIDAKRKQDGYGKTLQAGDNNMASALAATDEGTAASIIANTGGLYKSAVANGFMTPAQEIEQRNKWIKDYGQNKIQQFMDKGDAQGAQDWMNKHYNILNPTPEQAGQVNSAVTIPRAKEFTDKIVNGVSIANSNALTEARRQFESANRQLDKDGNPVLGRVLKDGQQAVGISQILPSTAREVANKMGIPFDMEKLKYDKEYNQLLGDAYQNEMIARYHGNQTLAMAAYNAGPNNVDKWIRANGNPDLGEITDHDFIAKIPFEETRNYVTQINAKVPPIPGVPQNNNEAERNQAWLSIADQIPESVAPLVKTGIQTRIEDGKQQIIVQQTNAAQNLIQPVLNGKLTDPAQLSSNNDIQTSWAIANPDLQKAVLAGMGDRNKDTKEYGDKFWDLYQSVHAKPGDPKRISDPTQLYKYGAGNGLTLAGIDRLTKEIEGGGTIEGRNEGPLKSTLLKSAETKFVLIPSDEEGKQKFGAFQAWFLPAYDKERASGKSSEQLLNPDSPDYMGKAIPAFARPQSERLADLLTDPMNYQQPRTAEDVRNEYKSGKLTKEQAKKELTGFGYK